MVHSEFGPRNLGSDSAELGCFVIHGAVHGVHMLPAQYCKTYIDPVTVHILSYIVFLALVMRGRNVSARGD